MVGNDLAFCRFKLVKSITLVRGKANLLIHVNLEVLASLGNHIFRRVCAARKLSKELGKRVLMFAHLARKWNREVFPVLLIAFPGLHVA